MDKERLDVLMVNRRLADSREKARKLITAGDVVYVNGSPAQKPGMMISPDAEIELRGVQMKYVSRGGYKLEKAMDAYGISLEDCVCMDVGSSTGGFTDCMLQNGASKVFAIDVGTDQLARKLREDPRVISMEQTNIRYVVADDIGCRVDFVSVDVAFISLTKVLCPVNLLMKEGAGIVCLIKPQFEAGRERVGKNGVVRDPAVHEDVIGQVLRFALGNGFKLVGLEYSPIRGPEGNIEYLAYMTKISDAVSASDDCEPGVISAPEAVLPPELVTLIGKTVEEANSTI